MYAVIITSAVFHEYAHGWVAYRLGDSTAKDAGRLTLNPLAHIDIVGTVLVPLFMILTAGIFIGWAKPVPYNPNNLKDKKYGTLKVGIAGPAANLLIATILGLFLRFAAQSMAASGGTSVIFLELLAFIVYINIFLALFNFIPFPPLDGSKVFESLFPRQWQYFTRLGFFGMFFALVIAFLFLPSIANFIFWLITGSYLGI